MIVFSQDNLVFHNNFVNNVFQAEVLGGTSNRFDNGPVDGGNHWSDFNEPAEGCSNTDGNGVCSTHFVFPGS